MKKVIVNKDICIACGQCMANAENVFGCDSQGLSEVKKDFVKDKEEQLAINAMENCPTNAIVLEDCEENTCCGHCEEGHCCENNCCEDHCQDHKE